MADDGNLRVTRHRRHKADDHSLCRPGFCPYAGRAERDDVRGLAGAVEREFADDPVRMATVRQLVELAGGRGQPAVSALVALDRMVESSRAGRYTPVYTGPVTINDEVVALANQIVEAEVERRLDQLEAEVAAHGWPAAVAALRAELKPELGEINGRGVR